MSCVAPIRLAFNIGILRIRTNGIGNLPRLFSLLPQV